MRIGWRGLLYGIVAAVAGSLVLLGAFTPGGRATLVRACPYCFGFEKLGAQAYIEHSANPSRRRQADMAIAGAGMRVRAFFGPPHSRPLFVICESEACFGRARAASGGALAVTVRGDTIVVSPRGINPVIAAHEWSHVELTQRVGRLVRENSHLPAWFDEGLAVVVAGDARYLAPAVARKYCPPGYSPSALPVSMPDWDRRAGNDRMLYAAAGCVVNHWLATHDGADGLKVLFADLRSGDNFAVAYAREAP